MKNPFIFFLFFLLGSVCYSVTPMEYFNGIVAGADEGGFHDGGFSQARFRKPCGLAFDDSGTKLFVADGDNNRIRTVLLDHANQVETLAGTGVLGHDDGPITIATFNRPLRVVNVSGNKLVVYEMGTNLLRLIDLERKSVSTLTSVGRVWDLAYDALDGSVYFSEPWDKQLRKLELKTSKVSVVFKDNKSVPAPKALCAKDGKIFVSDQSLPGIFEMRVEATGSTLGAAPNVSFKKIGESDHVLELGFSGEILYALRSGAVPLVRVMPDSMPVSLASPWGFVIDNENPDAEPLFRFDADQYVGFSSSPNEERKLYVSQPGLGLNSIVSVKDYSFDRTWKSESTRFGALEAPGARKPSDFDYPTKKPKDTFRILIVGDSRTYTAPRLIPGDNPQRNSAQAESDNSLRINTFPKRLEFNLNTQAALDGSRTHFEVLSFSVGGGALQSYAPYAIPPMASKYDVDLVLALVGFATYQDYYLKPIGPEGIPAATMDPEYVLKAASERIPPGPPSDLYEKMSKKNLLSSKEARNFPLFNDLLIHPEMRQDLLEMTEKPILVFSKKLDSVKISSGISPKLVLFFVPFRLWGNNDEVASFWTDICSRNKFEFMDLSEDYNALKFGYYPANQFCCSTHYTAYGSELVARILQQHLTGKKLIPIGPNK